jgi:hypothetical protein
MTSSDIKRQLEDHQERLEAIERFRQQQNKIQKRVQPSPKPYKPRLKKDEKTETQFPPSFLSTWDTMYRRRMRRSRVATPYHLPESLFDALLRTFELTIGHLIAKLLK